jgi:two-component system cell cycle response regulator
LKEQFPLRNSADAEPTHARQVVAALGLNADDDLARRLRSKLAGRRAEALVDACLSRLTCHADFSSADRLRQGWIDHLRTFGLDFDTEAYLADRKTFSADCARAGIPLALLHLQQSLILQSLIESVAGEDDFRSLAAYVLKLGALDAYLATEGHREAQVDALQEALAESHAEVSRLRYKASTDQLTGLESFSSLMEKLEREVGKADERRQPLCVFMADLDFFKKVNDTHGHLVGDMVLRHAAERMRAAVRDFDIVGRFGGEEFTVVLKNTDIGLAKVVAERIRHEVGGAPMHLKGVNIDITISLGGAMLRQGETKEALLGRADAALYEAKQAGRNRVIFAPA